MTTGTEDSSQQQKPPRWLSIIIVILLIPVVAAVIYLMNDRDIDTSAPLDPSCDLHRGPCLSLFPDGASVSLSIEPRPVRELTPLQLVVRTEGIEAQSVKVDFRGVDMDMGYHRPQLKQVAAGQYTGTWVLASCGLERMVWEATVLIETADHKMAAPFRLQVSYR